MAHTCRESCGVCGFLSIASKVILEILHNAAYILFLQDEQVVDAVSYSNYRNPNFDCGRFVADKEVINKGGEVPEIEGKLKCGATYINDR